jgi:GT2 family glycosyltransferase
MTDVGFYVSCFNAEKTLSFCLESILSQDYPVKEVVVVDDGSTDGTRACAARYPVRLILHESNRGLAAARNTAVRSIETDFIASIDADCVCEKNWLKELMGCFASDGIAGAGGKLLEKRNTYPADLWRAVHMKQHWGSARVEPPFLFGSNTVFRREALKKVGPYDEVLKNNYEDIDLCARLKSRGYVFIYEPNAVAYHLREDDVRSVLETYWQWHRTYYRQEKFYETPENFRRKIRENLGTANRYLEEDMREGRRALAYLDLLFALHHSLRDLRYLMEERRRGIGAEPTRSSLWLAFVDLMFLSRVDADTARVRTLVKTEAAWEQNGLALFFCLGRVLTDIFPEGDLKSILLGHLLGSVFGVEDPALAEMACDILLREPERFNFQSKGHPYLEKDFLEAFTSEFKVYMNSLTHRFPEAAQAIEAAARAT